MLEHIVYDMNQDVYQDLEKKFVVTFDKPNAEVSVSRYLGFIDGDHEYEFVGSFIASDDEMEELKDELRSGETPDGWEDGVGNTISL